MRSLSVILVTIAFLTSMVRHAEGQNASVTFDNRSGEFASIKLIGPSKPIAEVPSRQFRTIGAVYGNYYFMIRFGSEQYQYTYAKSDSFQIMEAPTRHEVITITLNPVHVSARHRTCSAIIDRAIHNFSFGLTTKKTESVALRCSPTEFLLAQRESLDRLQLR